MEKYLGVNWKYMENIFHIFKYMEDLFGNSVIKLTDKHFNTNGPNVTVTHPDFKNNDGYIMAYAPWCPNCQNKVDFWSYLGEKLNHDPQYGNEHFRVGVINTTDPSTSKILNKLSIDSIPRFLHVKPNGVLSEYDGDSYEPSEILSQACKNSKKLCKFKPPMVNM